jgi:hypothetical protein
MNKTNFEMMMKTKQVSDVMNESLRKLEEI